MSESITCVDAGGMTTSGSGELTRRISSLSSGFAGTIADLPDLAGRLPSRGDRAAALIFGRIRRGHDTSGSWRRGSDEYRD